MKRLVAPLAACLCIVGFGAALLAPSEAELARFATSLEGRTRSQRHNALLALEALDGAVIEAGETFSFNGRVGSFSRDRGYRKAPVSYNGQLIDSWGGGVCQTSTTLYNAALFAGLEIVERNRHRFAPSYIPPGRDAAVAFHAIDLRFRNPHRYAVRIQTKTAGNRLEITILGGNESSKAPQVVTQIRNVDAPSVFRLGSATRNVRLRNSGKLGFEVAVYRTWPGKRELISVDTYPAMHRIVEGY